MASSLWVMRYSHQPFRGRSSSSLPKTVRSIAVNKYERDAIKDVVTRILREHINEPSRFIDARQMRMIIEKGHAKDTYPFPVRDPSRSAEFAEEIDRLMREIGRSSSNERTGYLLSHDAEGKLVLTFFDKSAAG